jgi:predicted ATPase
LPRYVLTGAPGAGKTAMLRLLEHGGYPVVEEAATDVIALEQAQGRDQPSQRPGFIDQIVTLQRARQLSSPDRPQPVFFDRSPVCTLALARYLGYAPSPLLVAEVGRVLREQVYQPEVFFVQNQGFVTATAARRISFEDSLAFEQVHEQAYAELGFRLVRVPAGRLADRVALVLGTVGRLAAGHDMNSSAASSAPRSFGSSRRADSSAAKLANPSPVPVTLPSCRRGRQRA